MRRPALQFEAGFVGLEEQHHGARYERLLPAIAAAMDDGLMTWWQRRLCAVA